MVPKAERLPQIFHQYAVCNSKVCKNALVSTATYAIICLPTSTDCIQSPISASLRICYSSKATGDNKIARELKGNRCILYTELVEGLNVMLVDGLRFSI
jgi:hypothetical protein